MTNGNEDLIKNAIKLTACADQMTAAGNSLLRRIFQDKEEVCWDAISSLMMAIDELKKAANDRDDVYGLMIATFASAGFAVCMDRICQESIGGEDE